MGNTQATLGPRWGLSLRAAALFAVCLIVLTALLELGLAAHPAM
jgi:hypothetical protein